MLKAQLQGSVLVLILFDVCEEIRLEELGANFGRPASPGANRASNIPLRNTSGSKEATGDGASGGDNTRIGRSRNRQA